MNHMPDKERNERNVRIIAWIFIIYSAILILGSVIGLMFMSLSKSGGLNQLGFNIPFKEEIMESAKTGVIFELFKSVLAFFVLVSASKMLMFQEKGRRNFIYSCFAIILFEIIEAVLSNTVTINVKGLAEDPQLETYISSIAIISSVIWIIILSSVIYLIIKFLKRDYTKELFA